MFDATFETLEDAKASGYFMVRGLPRVIYRGFRLGWIGDEYRQRLSWKYGEQVHSMPFRDELQKARELLSVLSNGVGRLFAEPRCVWINQYPYRLRAGMSEHGISVKLFHRDDIDAAVATAKPIIDQFREFWPEDARAN